MSSRNDTNILACSSFTCVCLSAEAKREGHLFFLRHTGVALLVVAQVLYVPVSALNWILPRIWRILMLKSIFKIKRNSDLNCFLRCESGGMMLSTVRCLICIGLYFFVSKLLLLLYQRDKYSDHSSHRALTETWHTNSLMLHVVECVQCIRFWLLYKTFYLGGAVNGNGGLLIQGLCFCFSSSWLKLNLSSWSNYSVSM